MASTAPWLAAASAGATGAPPVGLPRPLRPTVEQREVLYLGTHGGRLVQPGNPPAPATGQDEYDVLDYDLTLSLNVPARRIDGACKVTFTPAPGVASLSEISLDLDSARLGVMRVTREGVGELLPFHLDDVLRIPLGFPPVGPMEAATVVVEYAGLPGTLGFGTPFFGPNAIASVSQPGHARSWWPCKDRPDDKATATLRVEAPAELSVVSNGSMVGTPLGSRPGRVVTTWRESYPISTYLVSIAAAPYALIESEYVALDGRPVPLGYWAYPNRLDAAREDWSITPAVLRHFAESFREYPFRDEKYGHAMVDLLGALEHQTVTSYGSAVVTGTHAYDFLLVHEVAHQWFGDFTGPRDWDSLWLNEGFATYCEALWTEHVGGPAEYREYLGSLDRYRACGSDFAGTVHGFVDADGDDWPDGNASYTVYDKGAWVLHMLRWVLGQAIGADPQSPPPEVIRQVLREHLNRHPHGSATTADFEQTVATLAGRVGLGSLDWFFAQWVHGTGRPRYELGWTTAPLVGPPTQGHFTFVELRQDAARPFRMPVAVRVTLVSGRQFTDVIDFSGGVVRRQYVDLEPAVAVHVDPDGWVLKCVTSVDIDRDDDGWPDDVDGCPRVPNPRQEDVDGNGIQDACQAGLDFDGDRTLNESDCAPADGGAWAPPGPDQEQTLLVGKAPGGAITLRYTASPTDMTGGTAQRPYSYDALRGDLGALRANGLVALSGCLAAGTPDLEVVDVQGSDPGNHAYLVLPWNGCGPTDPAGEPLSACR